MKTLFLWGVQEQLSGLTFVQQEKSINHFLTVALRACTLCPKCRCSIHNVGSKSNEDVRGGISRANVDPSCFFAATVALAGECGAPTVLGLEIDLIPLGVN